MHYILNILGSIVRDILLQFDGDFVDYTYIEGKYIYKSILPFSFSIGDYIFLTKQDFRSNLNRYFS